jgi:hypothetical protein
MEGDTMTRTMKDRNINIVSPKFLFALVLIYIAKKNKRRKDGRWREAYIV